MTCVCMHAELVWTAPELLKLRVVDVPFEGSNAGDVYSYGIILHQILCRSVPYGDDYSSSSKRSMVCLFVWFR
jgi:serine/threonine protein kinase